MYHQQGIKMCSVLGFIWFRLVPEVGLASSSISGMQEGDQLVAEMCRELAEQKHKVEKMNSEVQAAHAKVHKVGIPQQHIWHGCLHDDLIEQHLFRTVLSLRGQCPYMR